MDKWKKRTGGEERELDSPLIPGFHGVREALIKGAPRIEALWIAREKGMERVREILHLAEIKRIPVLYRNRTELNAALPGVAHQGIVALAGRFHYVDLEAILERILRLPDHALLVVADHITDEGNLGALIRTAAFFGAHGLVLPKDRSAKVTDKVLKRSSGAYAHVPVARVVNLGRALDRLNEKGFWIIGAAGEGTESVYGVDWNRDLALVLGREDRGLTRVIRERCHQVVRIPGAGTVEALNVAVAGGVILSEIRRQRLACGCSP